MCWSLLSKRLIRDLHIFDVFRSLSRFIHLNLSLRVNINSKTNLILVEIVYRVKVTQEGVTNQEQVFVLSG